MRTFTTMPHIADAMRDHLAAGRDHDALRVLVDGVNILPSLTSPGEIRVFLTRPQPLRDTRWDALLAAAVAYRARLAGVEPPRWTHVAPLDDVLVAGRGDGPAGAHQGLHAHGVRAAGHLVRPGPLRHGLSDVRPVA